jgi:hypothetical protein
MPANLDDWEKHLNQRAARETHGIARVQLGRGAAFVFTSNSSFPVSLLFRCNNNIAYCYNSRVRASCCASALVL